MENQQAFHTEQPPLDVSESSGPPANGNGNGQPANGNGRRSVRELADGDEVLGAFAVRERELRPRRDGSEWLRLVISDRTGTIEAVAWDGVDECYEAASPGTVIVIKGRFAIHPRYGPKVTIEAIRPAREGEYEPDEISDGPPVPAERLEADLRELISTIQSAQLRQLLDRIFGERSAVWERFRKAPAAKYYHQAYPHGLLDHTLSVAQAASAAAALFQGIDRDIAVTGALLHDIGKIEAYNDDPVAIEMTDAGRLQGEIPLGYYRVRRTIETIDGFDRDLAQAVLHIILSHHGKLENGSPVVPATREATLVHMLDDLGGRLGSFDRIERALRDGEAWSRFDPGIDSAAYFGTRAA